MDTVVNCLSSPNRRHMIAGKAILTDLSGVTLPLRRGRITRRMCARAEKRPEDSESTESLFAKELKRRGIAAESLSQTTKRGTREEANYDYDDTPPLISDGQFEKVRALGSEGLEGLIPRVKELLILGGTSTLAFLPIILVVASFAAALYFVFGDDLVHSGRVDMTPPQYVDPYQLLGYPYND